MFQSKRITSFFLSIISASGLGFAPACKENPPETNHAPGKMVKSFQDVQKFAKMFESPSRMEWQKPDLVTEKMNIKEGYHIADIGAGTGYFTRRFARLVGSKGRSIGYDTEPGMVDYMKKDAIGLKRSNYQAMLIQKDINLPAKSFDIIFLCNTYHHLENRVQYFSKLRKSLKKGGRIIIVDFYHRATPVGPPVAHKISRSQVKQEMESAGYSLLQSPEILPYQYYLEFK